MRISINLATRPFVELRPFFLRLRIIMGVLAVAGLSAIITAHVLQVRLDKAQAQIDSLHAKMVAAQLEKQSNERRMHQPANAAVLDRAHFLNALFLRKSFSWTAVMMDLETVLPTGVQVTSIEPSPTADGELIIRLRVSGDRDRAVQLVRNLERSRRFLSPRLTGEATQSKDGSHGNNTFAAAASDGPSLGVEFEILANYNPLPEGQAYAVVKAPREPAPSARDNSMVPAAKGYGVVLKPYSATHPQSNPGPPGRPPRGGPQ
jgi:type IV pilus assembly protein PilN